MASFGPLVVAPLFLSASSHSPAWARRGPPAVFAPGHAEALRTVEGGEQPRAFRGVALHAAGEHDDAAKASVAGARRPRGTLLNARPALSARREADDEPVFDVPKPPFPKPTSLEPNDPWAEPTERRAPCKQGDPLCSE